MEREWKILQKYQSFLSRISKDGLFILAESLGISHKEILGIIDQKSIEGIHLIHYFPLSKKSNPNARRQSKHCDNTLVTVIPSPYPVHTGIDVYNRKTKKWEHIVISKGSCLVQTGLILEHITCGAIKANLHTVSNPKIDTNKNVSRYSTPFFCSPKIDSTVKILEKYRKKCQEKDIALNKIEKQYFDKIF